MKKLVMIAGSVLLVAVGSFMLFYGNTEPPDWNPLTQAEKDTSKQIHQKYESDDSDFIYYRNFIVNYDSGKRRVNWVIHRVTKNQIYQEGQEAINRDDYDFEFFPDSTLNSATQVKTSEYTNTGWDRGHMAPAADFKYDLEAMTESHVTTNIAPQSVGLNQELWKELEVAIRDFIKEKCDEAYIIRGALYSNHYFRKCKNNQTSGYPSIYVPYRFYKVVYSKIDNENHLYCFLINHSLYYTDKEFSTYQVSLDKIEELTEEDFFDKLEDTIENDIEAGKRDIEFFLGNNN